MRLCVATKSAGECSGVLSQRVRRLYREALIQPEVFPCCIGDPVACPGVGNLMGNHSGGGAVASDESWGDKRQAWVLHATVWEAGGEHQQVILAPHVRLASYSLRCNICSLLASQSEYYRVHEEQRLNALFCGPLVEAHQCGFWQRMVRFVGLQPGKMIAAALEGRHLL